MADITFISDTHGLHDEIKLQEGTILVHAGDITEYGTEEEVVDFLKWFSKQPFEHKKIRPDIVIRKGTETIIVDTKWKVLDELVPGDEDLKQIFVYNLFWNCNKSILLYPSLYPNAGEGNYYSFDPWQKPVNKCGVITVSVFDNQQKLDVEFGFKTLYKILSQV